MAVSSIFNDVGKGVANTLDYVDRAIDFVATPLIGLDTGVRTTMLLGLGLGLAPTTAVIGGIVAGGAAMAAFNYVSKSATAAAKDALNGEQAEPARVTKPVANDRSTSGGFGFGAALPA